jgi:hypothetical protein
MGPRVRRREPETLCREAFSSQAMAVLHDPDTRVTTHCPAEPARTPRSLAFPLVIFGCGAPRRNRTGDPSLPWNHQEPLCGPPFPQLAPDRRGRSYRFSFGEVMRSLVSHVVIVPGVTDHPTSDHRIQPAFLHRSIIGRSLRRMTSVLGANGSSGHNVTAALAASRIAAPSTSTREVGSSPSPAEPADRARRPVQRRDQCSGATSVSASSKVAA